MWTKSSATTVPCMYTAAVSLQKFHHIIKPKMHNKYNKTPLKLNCDTWHTG